MNKISKLYTTEEEASMYFWGVYHNEAPINMPTSIDGGDSNKEEKLTPVDYPTAPASIDAKLNKYYRIDADVDTMGIALPEATENDAISYIIFMFTAGDNPNITFTSASQNICYQEGYTIDANKTYEINCLWNGEEWVVASLEIKNASAAEDASKGGKAIIVNKGADAEEDAETDETPEVSDEEEPVEDETNNEWTDIENTDHDESSEEGSEDSEGFDNDKNEER